MGVDEATAVSRRRVRLRAAAAACALMLAVGGIAACGDDDESAATTATSPDAALCASVDDFETSLSALKDVSLTGTSQTDLASIFANISSAWSGLKAAMANAADADKAEVESAFDDLKTAVTTLPGGDVSIDEYVANVKAKVPPLESAVKDLAPGCGVVTGTTTGTTTG